MVSLFQAQKEELCDRQVPPEPPSLAMVAVDGHHEAITIPADETLDLSGKKLNGERLMDVLWRGRPVMMFVADLKLATVVI